MPVFDGLFPSTHNEVVQELIFICAHWHAMAKFRIHTDETLRIFEVVTQTLGRKFDLFEEKTCSSYTTFELPSEAEKRHRQKSRKSRKSNSGNAKEPTNSGAPESQKESTTELGTTIFSRAQESHRKTVMFSRATYKYHALADYPNMIRRFGTCDSYSTEPVSNIFMFIDLSY
jgi:hypothetical protein